MRKDDKRPFGEFMLAEAARYGRELTTPEIETWWETFKAKRVTLDDFKLAWAEHKKDPKHGVYFPNTVMVERYVRSKVSDQTARDWRCSEEVNGERCGFPGGISVGRGQQCMAHHRLCGSADYSDAASLQIIEQSRAYVPPKTPMELMERGAKQREEEGRRWREAHPNLYRAPVQRAPADALPRASIPRPADEAPLVMAEDIDRANLAAALAAQEAT